MLKMDTHCWVQLEEQLRVVDVTVPSNVTTILEQSVSLLPQVVE
jgi:hypothetical protein